MHLGYTKATAVVQRLEASYPLSFGAAYEEVLEFSYENTPRMFSLTGTEHGINVYCRSFNGSELVWVCMNVE